jgi:hypothetical protein
MSADTFAVPVPTARAPASAASALTRLVSSESGESRGAPAIWTCRYKVSMIGTNGYRGLDICRQCFRERVSDTIRAVVEVFSC